MTHRNRERLLGAAVFAAGVLLLAWGLTHLGDGVPDRRVEFGSVAGYVLLILGTVLMASTSSRAVFREDRPAGSDVPPDPERLAIHTPFMCLAYRHGLADDLWTALCVNNVAAAIAAERTHYGSEGGPPRCEFEVATTNVPAALTVVRTVLRRYGLAAVSRIFRPGPDPVEYPTTDPAESPAS